MPAVQIEESWRQQLEDTFTTPYFSGIVDLLRAEKAKGTTIYPAGKDIFRAFELTPFPKVKVVILGQDPYHNPGQAHGLSFSVPQGVPHPPSLQNIFKEINDDLGFPVPVSGDLSYWARQGVLLLNASLTVVAHQPNSHAHIGWHQFTDEVIARLSEKRDHLVFLLWGSFAQQKSALIDADRHLVLKTVHPSPLSAYRGFFGCHHFSKTNEYLMNHNKKPIDWHLAAKE